MPLFSSEGPDRGISALEQKRRSDVLHQIEHYLGPSLYVPDNDVQKDIDQARSSLRRLQTGERIQAGAVGAGVGALVRTTGHALVVDLAGTKVVPGVLGLSMLARAIQAERIGGSGFYEFTRVLPTLDPRAPFRKARQEWKDGKKGKAITTIATAVPLLALSATTIPRQIVTRLFAPKGFSGVTNQFLDDMGKRHDDIRSRNHLDHYIALDKDQISGALHHLLQARKGVGQVGHDPGKDAATIARDIGRHLDFWGEKGLIRRHLDPDHARKEAFLIDDLVVSAAGMGELSLATAVRNGGSDKNTQQKNLNKTKGALHQTKLRGILRYARLGIFGASYMAAMIPEYILGVGLGNWAANTFIEHFGPYFQPLADEVTKFRDEVQRRAAAAQVAQNKRQGAVAQAAPEIQSQVVPTQGQEVKPAANIPQALAAVTQEVRMSRPSNITDLWGVPLPNLQLRLRGPEFFNHFDTVYPKHNITVRVEDGTAQALEGLDYLGSDSPFTVKVYNAASGGKVFLVHSGYRKIGNMTVPEVGEGLRDFIQGGGNDGLKIPAQSMTEQLQRLNDPKLVGYEFSLPINGQDVRYKVIDTHYIDHSVFPDSTKGINPFVKGKPETMWWQRMTDPDTDALYICSWGQPGQQEPWKNIKSYADVNKLDDEAYSDFYNWNGYLLRIKRVG